jgi:4a-hydroxytetrahydrobiopterin dehydratase
VSDLSERKCEACHAGTPTLDAATAGEMKAQIHADWVMEDNRIERRFKFKNFRDAFGLATKVALLAEQQGHHPDFELGWGFLKLTLTTHAAKGLTDNDFILAAKIDEL